MRAVVVWIIFILVMLALLAWFTSCSSPPQKLRKLLKNHPELLKTDTIIYRDTVYLSGVSKDTLYRPGKDTVIIKEGKLTVKTFYNRITDTLFVSGKCDADTVKIEVPVPQKTYHSAPSMAEIFRNYWWVVLGLIIVVVWLIFKR